MKYSLLFPPFPFLLPGSVYYLNFPPLSTFRKLAFFLSFCKGVLAACHAGSVSSLEFVAGHPPFPPLFSAHPAFSPTWRPPLTAYPALFSSSPCRPFIAFQMPVGCPHPNLLGMCSNRPLPRLVLVSPSPALPPTSLFGSVVSVLFSTSREANTPLTLSHHDYRSKPCRRNVFAAVTNRFHPIHSAVSLSSR